VINAQHWLAAGGVAILAAIVFAESGLLIGFFLPGDSALFAAGYLSSAAGGHVFPWLPITGGVVFLAAAGGDQVGYLFGRRVGPALFSRPRSRLFSPDNVSRARTYFERRGAGAIVAARFIPIVRTITPVIAGVAHMRYRTFFAYNLLGAAMWGAGLTAVGYFLGAIPFLGNHLQYATAVILVLSCVPVVLEYRRFRGANELSAG
jgi:membrane-associated protein